VNVFVRRAVLAGGGWVTAVIAAGLLVGCAQPGVAPADPPSRFAGVVRASSAPSVPRPVAVSGQPGEPGQPSCARDARPVPSIDPSASFDLSDAQQRALRALAAQNRPTPRRGAVPEAAVPAAEACVQDLRRHFTLLTANASGVPDESTVDAALRSAGLTKIVVRPGQGFAASTGTACLYGTFTEPVPDFAIGPRAADGSCPR
jgi:hypothetical protein